MGNTLTIDEVRDYFRSFKCKVLTSSEHNRSEIQGFSSSIKKNRLEKYLKNEAWDDDESGKTRVFLVRDDKNQIVAYFSLKCGMVFVTDELDDEFQCLSDKEKDIVNTLIQYRVNMSGTGSTAVYNDIVKSMANEIGGNRLSRLLKITEHKAKTKREIRELAPEQNGIMRVKECCAAIELQHFCKCDEYKMTSGIRYPLGFGLFWEQIVPKVSEIAENIGCEYLYLFAADNTDEEGKQKLVDYYITALGFSNLNDEGVIALMPDYDRDCVGLQQKSEYLFTTRENKWQEFSDLVLDENKTFSELMHEQESLA